MNFVLLLSSQKLSFFWKFIVRILAYHILSMLFQSELVGFLGGIVKKPFFHLIITHFLSSLKIKIFHKKIERQHRRFKTKIVLIFRH